MKLILAFALIFTASFTLFLPSLTYYFFQDDWFVLNWVQTGDLASFLSFRTDIIYWRPLSMPLLFWVANKLLGLNVVGYHLIAFSIFFALIIAVYKLFLEFHFNRKSALTASFSYAVWPIHFISLSWFSTTAYIIGTLFQVLSFIFFIKYVKNKKNLFFLVSFCFFILSIASTEFTLILPAIFLAWAFLVNKKLDLKFLMSFIIIDLIYILIRFYLVPVPAKDDYQLYFGKQIINNYIWYLLWAIGLPENFKTLIFPRLIGQSINLITQFWTITLPVFLLFLLLAKEALVSYKHYLRFYIFGLAWFSVGLLPVIAVTNHSFPMYLSFAGLGFIFILINSIKNSPLYILISFLILWLVISFSSLKFTRSSHWIINEQAVSRAYINFIQKNVPNPAANSIFIFKPANHFFSKNHAFLLVEGQDTLRQSLADQNAVQVIYKNSSIKSIFATHQQKVELPKDSTVFEISPREDQ